ncbi:MAG: MBG domain-containing protein [Pirellulales bacterium]
MTVDYGDGTGPQPLAFTNDRTFKLEHEYTLATTSPFQVVVTAVDNNQVVGIGVMGVSVGNEPPEVSFNNFELTPQVYEGEPVTLTGFFSDSGTNDSHTVTIVWGDGTAPTIMSLPVGSRTFASTHIYPDDDIPNTSRDLYRVLVTVADNLGGFSTTPDGLYVVEVINSAPSTPVLTTPSSLIENQLFALSGSFTDLGLEDTHRVLIDWGDGLPKETVTASQLISDPVTRRFDILHRYLDNPAAPETSYTIRVEVSDDDDPLNPTVATRSIVVANEQPLIANIVQSRTSMDEGDQISLDIEINDDGTLDSHQLVIDWGDGSETKTISLAPNVLTVSGVSHTYRNDPAVGSLYPIVVKVRDKDMAPGLYASELRNVTVSNVAPIVDSLKLFTRDTTGQWIERPSGYAIHEGAEVKITGQYSDPGVKDTHVVNVQWAAGHTTSASVDNGHNRFEAKFRYTDDFAVGTAFDDETITVSVIDSDGASGLATTTVRVENVAPTASYLPEVITDPQYNLIPLKATAFDPGSDVLSYSWTATVGSSVIQTGTGASFVLDRTNQSANTIVVSLVVTDGDLGVATYQSAFKFGTSASETINVSLADFPGGIDTLTILGLDGDDVIDATTVPATHRVILDGGNGQDFLYGGSGDDVYILRSGNDSANLDRLIHAPPPGATQIPAVTPNYVGKDRYYLKPNSTLSVVDPVGNNALDYTLASFGITFNLDTTRTTTLISQEVAPGGHFVAAAGYFDELRGSAFNDQLTGASDATVIAGDGDDKLFAVSNTTGARFNGDAGSDEFTTSGIGIGAISFEGDDGIDSFTNLGTISGSVVFSGGADDDLLNNLGSVQAGLSFEGDDGSDQFVNALGASVINLSFGGDAGNDFFVNRGTITNSIGANRIAGDDGADVFNNYGTLDGVIFTGGADDDVITNYSGTMSGLSFEGDDGSDQFVNSLGATVVNLSFEGDDGDDRFINQGTMINTLATVAIRGDDGADSFENNGTLSDLIFFGGADSDSFTNRSAIVGGIRFQGDDGADVFTNVLGASILNLSFEGDGGDDRIVNFGLIDNTANTLVRVQGDDGADDFENYGSLVAVAFAGGADDDIFVNQSSGVLAGLSFEGDDGNDVFVNLLSGRVDNLSFAGDLGADYFLNYGSINNSSAPLSVVRGDDGEDLFENFGNLTNISFAGGSDDDVFINAIGGSVALLNFQGDSGSDEFLNLGSIVGAGGLVFGGGADDDLFVNAGQIGTGLVFQGGADDDLLINQPSASIGELSFVGDSGTDELVNQGTVIGNIAFTGGADDDILVNSVGGTAGHISFVGDDGADELINRGSAFSIVFTGGADDDRFSNSANLVDSLVFVGGADDDVFQNVGNSISSLSFEGDDGADVFISLGNNIDSLSFEGDDGADLFIVSGTGIDSLNFGGDSNDTGSDTFVNRSTAAHDGSLLRFVGFGGNDALRNDGSGWRITFIGGADADVLQNNAPGLSNLSFEGDDGADVLENNGDRVVGISFQGDDGADIFANDGRGVSNISFQGGSDDDLFLNTGDLSSGLSFSGDDGSDYFTNLGDRVSGVTFTGGADGSADRFLNFGTDLNNISFVGGPGNDQFQNRTAAVRMTNLYFEGDDGADVFVNFAAEVSAVLYRGGADADLFQNNGISLGNFSFEGDDGDDQATNLGSGLWGFTFYGGNGNDLLENSGNNSTNIQFFGEAGKDSLIHRGSQAGAITFSGGDDNDSLVNYGSLVSSLSFEGDAGDDRLQNNGDDVATLLFEGDAGSDALQNNGDLIGSLTFVGGADADTLLNNGSTITLLSFEGNDGADSLVTTGNQLSDIVFNAGNDADLIQVNGLQIGNVTFEGGSGDDTYISNATTTTGSIITITAGNGDDVLVLGGVASHVIFAGDAGNDRIVLRGSLLSADLNIPSALNPQADQGDDRYEFTGLPVGAIRIGETYGGLSDASQDTLDFSASQFDSVVIDMASLALQTVSTGLTLQLTSSMGIENVIGTSGPDTVRGNERDNYLAGAQFYYGETGQNQAVAKLRPTQWVWLDFDSANNELSGEHVYTVSERQAIRDRLEATYGIASQWFNVRFAFNTSEIPSGIDYATIRFNETPSYGRPGGESTEIDLGNLNYGGEAKVQVNGLLGGIEIPASPESDFLSALPEDSTTVVGRDLPAGTSANLIALSAKIAAHELGHLLGLRHYDSFGPVNFGVHSPPGVSEFKPQYQGASAAFETFDHIIGSPASVGSTRQNDVGSLFFGEREAVKIAFAMSGNDSAETGTWTDEQDGQNRTVDTAQTVAWSTISVPNTLFRGLNSAKSFLVDTLAVSGQIGLAGNVSENDYYSFEGQAGDVVSIELFSQALRRFTNNGVDGYIDSVLRLYRRIDANTVVPVDYYGSSAINDDEFESTDSLLMDVTLPVSGEYIVEVDTFTRQPRITDPTPDELATWEVDAQSAFEDVIQDTDVGSYQLFAYRFAKASSIDDIDFLEGRGGIDIIDGGPGDLGVISFGSFPAVIDVDEGGVIDIPVSFEDVRGESWTLTGNYGDGSTIENQIGITPTTGFVLNHGYAQDGIYQLEFSVTNNYGLTSQQTIQVRVANVAPAIENLVVAPSNLAEGQYVTLSGTISDAGSDDQHQVIVDWGDGTTSTELTLAAGQVSLSNLQHQYSDNGDYLIAVHISDDDAAFADSTTPVSVESVAPVGVVSVPANLIYGDAASISIGEVYDPSSIDSIAGFRFAFSLNLSDLNVIHYANASASNEFDLSGLSAGDHDLYVRVFDKDDAFTQYTSTITVSPRLLEITADAKSKIYGDANPLLTAVVTGLVNGDVLNYSLSTTAGQLSNVGSYPISVTAAPNSNYSIVTTNSLLTITPKSATIVADAKSKIYGDANPLLTAVVNVLVNGDVLNYSLTTSAGQLSNVGSYPISVTVVPNNNYSIVTTDSLITIGQRGVTVTANAHSKTYGDADPVLDYGFSALAPGDGQSIFSGALSRLTGENVGTYPITQGTLSAGVNYAINFVGATFVINPATLTVAADAKIKNVGQADPAFTYTVSGTKFSDTASSIVTGSLTRQPGETVGVYNILQGSITVGNNYSLNYIGNTLTINGSANSAPTVAINTPVDGFMGIASVFTLSAVDADSVDQAGVFTYNINWGNGVTTTVSGPSTKTVSYIYPGVAADGSFQITVTVTDPRGAVSLPISKVFVVGGWTLMTDPINPNKAILVVSGSQGKDTIKIKLKDDNYYKIKIVDRDDDVQRKGTIYGDVDRILVYGHADNDRITIEDDISEPTEIWGGNGDDEIKGGSGPDIILGEAGDDNLWGGDGRDIIIGGLGADRIHGDAHDDVLIAGFTLYESSFVTSAPSAFGNATSLTHRQHRASLEAILVEWNSTRSYDLRRQNILGTGSGPRLNGSNYLRVSNASMTLNTVFDDGAVDKLWGDSGTDWFFANIVGDLGNVLDEIRDRTGNESSEDLDKWW